MKLKNKLGPITAVVVTFAAVTWMVIGGNGITTSPSETSSQTPSHSSLASSDQPNTAQNKNAYPVQAKSLVAESVELHISLTGKTLASESLLLINSYAGRITDLKVEKGQLVNKGQSLLQIDNRTLTMELAQANLLVKQRQLELDGIKQLNLENFSSRVNLAQAETELAAAKSTQSTLRVHLENASVTAPFSGVINSLDVKQGQVLSSGAEIGTLVSLDPLKVSVNIPQSRIHQISLGTQASIRFESGDRVDGMVSFISAIANEASRTIAVEILVNNPNNRIQSGLTASVDFTLDEQLAHSFSAALLTLDNAGQTAVKTLDVNNVVVLSPVDVIKSDRENVWVSGLPTNVNIITVGQGFVSPGDSVTVHYPN